MVLSRYKSITYSSACNQKGNKKSRNYDTQSSLFDIESDGLERRCNQFVGFVTSHRKGNVLVSFHIHSFAVFYTEEGPATIVTCLLTARNHILSNMQDQILQIVQLIQYRISNLFSILITNNFIGEEVTFDENSVCGYKMMGFNTLKEDEESNIFSLRHELLPIPFSVLGDSYSWAKYGHHILPSILSLSSREKVQLHDPFWKCLLALLQTDLDGNLYSTPNCHTSAKIESFYPTSSQVTKITRLVVLCLISFCYILQPQTTWLNLSRRRRLAQLRFH